jgi:hypothetical protein
MQSGAPHAPLLPETMSFKFEVCEYRFPAGFALAYPASAKTEATMGVATDVPPKTSHPLRWKVS